MKKWIKKSEEWGKEREGERERVRGRQRERAVSFNMICFQLTTQKRVYHLMALRDSEPSEWIERITTAINTIL